MTVLDEAERFNSIANRILQEGDVSKKEAILNDGISSINLIKREEVEADLSKEFRSRFSWWVLVSFGVLNIFVISIIGISFHEDLIRSVDLNYKRFIDQSVILALIAGTVTQTALAFGILTQFVFKVFDRNRNN